MGLERAHSYLVHPAKGADSQPEIRGTKLNAGDNLHAMLGRVFDRAADECDIGIIFQPDSDGSQTNPCRDELLTHAFEPELESGLVVAQRLQSVTTHRSGLGLLFLLVGQVNGRHRLVLSRFPADQGVIAEEQRGALSVKFLERVFMKSAKAYKSAVYQTDSRQRGFWQGSAIDRQISGTREVSDYWVREFLVSELTTTPALGTKRLATAVRTAITKAEDLDVRQELVAAATLLRSNQGKTLSARTMLERIGVGEEGLDLVVDAFPRQELLDESFAFDADEFDRQIRYRALELDNGALMIADDRQFDEVFNVESLDDDEQVQVTTEGRIVDERLRMQR